MQRRNFMQGSVAAITGFFAGMFGNKAAAGVMEPSIMDKGFVPVKFDRISIPNIKPPPIPDWVKGEFDYRKNFRVYDPGAPGDNYAELYLRVQKVEHPDGSLENPPELYVTYDWRQPGHQTHSNTRIPLLDDEETRVRVELATQRMQSLLFRSVCNKAANRLILFRVEKPDGEDVLPFERARNEVCRDLGFIRRQYGPTAAERHKHLFASFRQRDEPEYAFMEIDQAVADTVTGWV